MKNPFNIPELGSLSMSEVLQLNQYDNIPFNVFGNIIKHKSQLLKSIGEKNYKLLTKQRKIEDKFLTRKQNDINFNKHMEISSTLNNYLL